MRFNLLVAAIGAATLCATSAHAAVLTFSTQNPSYSLGSLITNGNSIQVGDKLFSNFRYLTVGDMPLAGDVNVSLPIVASTGTGLGFSGNFHDNPGGGASDALLTYDVTVLDPNFSVIGAHIDGNPSVIGNNGGAFVITETFLPQNTTSLMNIYNINGANINLSSDVSFPSKLQTFSVQKDIYADAGPAIVTSSGVTNNAQVVGASSTMSFVDQTYYQVPEPASMSLLALGGASILVRRRRKA